MSEVPPEPDWPVEPGSAPSPAATPSIDASLHPSRANPSHPVFPRLNPDRPDIEGEVFACARTSRPETGPPETRLAETGLPATGLPATGLPGTAAGDTKPPDTERRDTERRDTERRDTERRDTGRPEAPPLIEAIDIGKHYRVGSAFGRGGRRTLHALAGVSLAVQAGETLGLVGESGCGKSTLGRALLRLLDVDAGRIRFEGRDITRLDERAMRPLRARMQMVFQDPYSSLNPRRRVGDLVAEPLLVHGLPGGARGDRASVREAVRALLERVGLRAEHADRFPHEFSGGQRQRVGIARALALRPRLLVADEPVSALDVSVQAQIVNLFADLQDELHLTYVFIAHDLSVVRQMATRVAVMYLGTIVELGPTDTVLHRPAHPYTAALIAAIPRVRARTDRDGDGPGLVDSGLVDSGLAGSGRVDTPRAVLRGDPPSPLSPPEGCRFHTRCPIAKKRCVSEAPVLRGNDAGHAVACHFPLG